MSTILLQEAKDFLQVVHDLDDTKIQRILDAAEDEAREFMNREELPERNDACPCSEISETSEVSESTPTESSSNVAGSVWLAVMLTVQSEYEPQNAYRGGLDMRDLVRKRVQTLLTPYRCGMGV